VIVLVQIVHAVIALVVIGLVRIVLAVIVPVQIAHVTTVLAVIALVVIDLVRTVHAVIVRVQIAHVTTVRVVIVLVQIVRVEMIVMTGAGPRDQIPIGIRLGREMTRIHVSQGVHGSRRKYFLKTWINQLDLNYKPCPNHYRNALAATY
jgi:hypothetical protein